EVDVKEVSWETRVFRWPSVAATLSSAARRADSAAWAFAAASLSNWAKTSLAACSWAVAAADARDALSASSCSFAVRSRTLFSKAKLWRLSGSMAAFARDQGPGSKPPDSYAFTTREDVAFFSESDFALAC